MRHRSTWLFGFLNLCVFSLGTFLGLTSFTGCGGKSEKSSPKKTSDKNISGSSNQASSNPVNGTTRRGASDKNGVWTDARGQKMWGKHPYDIWYPDAYAVARNTNPVGTSTSANNSSPKTATKQASPMKAAKSSGDWQQLAPIAILDAEIKRIRNLITQKTQTVGQYNGNYRDIQYNAATLAAIAQIAATHPDSISWKKNAYYIRDLGTKINKSADGLGRKKYDATKLSFEQFVDIMNGNNPPDSLKKPEPSVTFDEAASRFGLMRRMDQAHKWLLKEVRDEATLKSENETVIHEATMLAVLSKVIMDSSYDSTDEPEYREFAQNMVNASTTMVSAAKSGNYKGYRMAVDSIINNCNNCHTNYK
ncbi:MAG: hypothetical protein Tsb009_29410 [Planctomycetaceae bacterium]